MSKLIRTAALSAALACGLQTAQLHANAPSQNINKPVDSEAQLTESQRANRLFDTIFDSQVAREPEWQTYLGLRKDYDKWDDISEAAAERELAHNRMDLQKLQGLDYDALDAETQLSYRLLQQQLENRIADYQWRHHNYPVNQMFGVHSKVPAFLINQHSIANVQEAEDYISRLNDTRKLIDQLIEQLKIRADKGIIAPYFVFEHVIRDSGNILRGAPFEGGEDSTLLADFNNKIARLDISEQQRYNLRKRAEMALLHSVQPAYRNLIAYLGELQQLASADAGVWKLPEGEAFYRNRLQRITTTDLSADEIHQIGLDEVSRIHDEMRAIRDQVGFQGDLAAFMAFMREDQRFYLPSDDQGRQQYLDQAQLVIGNMEERLDELFIVKPQASLEVKRVEEFREKSAGKAFYQQPSADGSRPGKYYANLYDMTQMPTYQLEALAYHEGLPGHHMQIAIKQELQHLPKFRRFGGVTAYSEGWGLYSELLPKEIGLYQDPYSDFGRLAMELWRAVRLVVDTGMHAKGWTREQSIEFYAANTPNARADAVKMVERHAVMPGQATAYKIGMLKILQEREKARTALAGQFDIREFHDVVLKNGAVPMNVLEAEVDRYIEHTRAAGEAISACEDCEAQQPYPAG